MRRAGEHAVVIGAGMGGLVAARALADHFRRVTVLERDALQAADGPRKGVPQGQHAHGLLARGREALEELFPGLTDELAARGAPLADLSADCAWFIGGGYLSQGPSGLVGILASRPLLEGAVRRRVERHRRVRVASGSAVAGLLVGSGRVEGVRLAAGGAAAALRADLVVDASGRSSRCREWLAEAGFQPPEEERVEVGIGYTTRRYRRRPLRGGKLAVLSQAAPPAWRSAAALAQEGDTWIVSLGGYLGDRAPAEERGFLEYARSVASPEIARIVETAEPVSGFASFGHRASVRRRCERLASFPEGLLLFGDALCSFNPVYGQGISVAAVEAGALARCLTLGTDGLAPRFFAAAARIVDAPWQLAAGGDLRHPRVPGPRTARSLTVNWYLAALHAAAHRDPALTRAFLAVTNLLEPPGSLFLPPVALRVARGLLARAAAAGLASPAGRGAFARAPTEGASGVAAASWIPISRSPRRARPRELPPGPRP